MLRRIVIGLLPLALLSPGVRDSAIGDNPIQPTPEKAQPGLRVRLAVHTEEKYAKVYDIFKRVEAQGATLYSLDVLKAGKGASAETVADPETPSKRVAAVVKALLDSGITKITVEVKNKTKSQHSK